jgi:2-dehydro-3-deoxygluconokinase
MPKQIVCFGEIMLRLSPLAPHERLVKTNALKMGFAGAESNVAVSLAISGRKPIS